ncbi:MAG: Undecaprenyl phosphate-alpha-4-amino-4-deoxy-L-arabinose arabinosyl transferase [Bacteroidota bacterium]|nr:Undecaprenyl phosphate-alpha-4-amino-4-deoxy-L-arabinose arabinosyl transferase [Bacteroidota bacterium]
MPHYFIALAAVTLATVSIICSYFQYRKGNFRISALFLVLAALFLRLYMASDQYLHEWDERYHALVAKNMLDNFFLPKLYKLPLLTYNYRDWSSGYIWLHKQPLPLWCMALSMKLFGVNEFALRLPSVLISTFAVYLTYFIGKKLFGQKIGLLAAFFHAINGLVLEMTGGRVATDHVDVFFLFFVELAVVFTIVYSARRQMIFNVLTGICIGSAVLCKWLPAFVVVPIWLALNYNRLNFIENLKGLTVIIVSAFVVFMPWQIYCHTNFPLEYANEMGHNYRHITEVLDGNTGGVFYFVDKLFITLNEFIWIALFCFCFKLYKGDRVPQRLALWFWAALPFLFFTIAKTKMQGYLLFTYPALFIILAGFCDLLLIRNDSSIKQILQRLVFAIVVGLSIRFSIERIKPLQDQSAQIYWANELRNMEDKTGKKVYFNVKHCIEGMFYTNSIMYGFTPSPEQIEELKLKGYEVIINQNPKL